MRPSFLQATRPGRGSLRSAAARCYARPGRCVLPRRLGGRRWLDRVANCGGGWNTGHFAQYSPVYGEPLYACQSLVPCLHATIRPCNSQAQANRISKYYSRAAKGGACEIADGVYESIARMLVVFSRFPDLNKSNIHELDPVRRVRIFPRSQAARKGCIVRDCAHGRLGIERIRARPDGSADERRRPSVRQPAH